MLFLARARHTVDGGAKQRCFDLMNSLMKNSNYFTERVNLLRVAFVQGNRHKGKVSEGWWIVRVNNRHESMFVFKYFLFLFYIFNYLHFSVQFLFKLSLLLLSSACCFSYVNFFQMLLHLFAYLVLDFFANPKCMKCVFPYCAPVVVCLCYATCVLFSLFFFMKMLNMACCVQV